MAMFLREHAHGWSELAGARNGEGQRHVERRGARHSANGCTARGAMFSHELASGCGLTVETVRQALGELVSAGLAASDGFAGLRSLIADKDDRPARRPDGGHGGPPALLPVAAGL